MKIKKKSLFILFFLISCSILIPNVSSSDNAGVGVMNVAPNFADIRVLQQEGAIRVYLTISDYNSWRDIYKVNVLLEEDGAEIASFIFQQHTDTDTFDYWNKFYEESNTNLLNIDSCDISHSEKFVTVTDRCHLDLRFVFESTFFSQLHIITEDRAGDKSEIFVEYYAGADVHRDVNTLLIPWIDGTIKFNLPPYLIDISILISTILITVFIAKKSGYSQKLHRVFYEAK